MFLAHMSLRLNYETFRIKKTFDFFIPKKAVRIMMLSYGLKSYDFAIVPSLVGTNVLDSGRRSDCNGSVTAEGFHLASPIKNAYTFTGKGYIYIRYIVSLIVINCKVKIIYLIQSGARTYAPPACRGVSFAPLRLNPRRP